MGSSSDDCLCTYIYHKNQLNAGRYTIHGIYGMLISGKYISPMDPGVSEGQFSKVKETKRKYFALSHFFPTALKWVTKCHQDTKRPTTDQAGVFFGTQVRASVIPRYCGHSFPSWYELIIDWCVLLYMDFLTEAHPLKPALTANGSSFGRVNSSFHKDKGLNMAFRPLFHQPEFLQICRVGVISSHWLNSVPNKHQTNTRHTRWFLRARLLPDRCIISKLLGILCKSQHC